MDGPGALQPALGGHRIVGVERATALAPNLPAVIAALEAERLLEQSIARLWLRRVGSDSVEALERHLTRNLRVFGDQRLVARVDNRFFFQAEDGIRDYKVTGVQTCALPI